MENEGKILVQNRYNRKSAVSYALNYALKPNPGYRYFNAHGDGGGDCSNFVSQCLRAGGAQMDYNSSRPWWYKSRGSNQNHDTWSVSWAVAHSLYWCLKSRGKLKLPGLKGVEINDINMLEIGDIIQYEDNKGIIYHSGIITDFAIEKGERIPLISQHSFDAINTSYIKSKAVRMHFMKIVI